MRFFKTHQYYMLDRVKTQLTKNKTKLCAKVPVLKKLIPEYLEKFGVIEKLIIGKIKVTAIATSDKKTAKGGLIEATLKLVDMLRTHYSSEDSKAMPVEATYTFSRLNKSNITNLPKLCALVIAEAKKIPDLRDYGLSVGDINEAEAYLEEYLAVKKAPQLKKEEIAKWNDDINRGIAECIIFLENKIDPMIRRATEDDHELKVNYFSRRKVLGRGPGNISDKEKGYRQSRKKAKVKAKAKVKRVVKKRGE